MITMIVLTMIITITLLLPLLLLLLLIIIINIILTLLLIILLIMLVKLVMILRYSTQYIATLPITHPSSRHGLQKVLIFRVVFYTHIIILSIQFVLYFTRI